MTTFGQAFGDHLDGASEWLDDASHRGGPCPHCASDQTLVRFRAAYGHGLPVHRHEVLACLTCDRFSAVCFLVLSDPQVLAWQ